jgi:hypothetical protein
MMSAAGKALMDNFSQVSLAFVGRRRILCGKRNFLIIKAKNNGISLR